MNEVIMNESDMKADVAYAICGMNEIASQKARGFQLAIVAEDGTHKSFPILVVRWGRQVFGYVNRCPHDGVNLDWERNHFLDPNGVRLMCGKHGALFELGTGICVEGPCKGRGLTPVALTIIDNDICVTGVKLVEDEEVVGDDLETSVEAAPATVAK
jgi:nitrite reductase/ring-hydroxylating ferredoxin subunit